MMSERDFCKMGLLIDKIPKIFLENTLFNGSILKYGERRVVNRLVDCFH